MSVVVFIYVRLLVNLFPYFRLSDFFFPLSLFAFPFSFFVSFAAIPADTLV